MENVILWLSQPAWWLNRGQWLLLLALLVGGEIAGRLIAWLLGRALRRTVARFHPELVVPPGTTRPFGIAAAAAIWTLALHSVGLPDAALQVLSHLTVALGVIAAVLGLWRLVDVLASVLEFRAEATPQRFDDLLAPMLRNVLKVAVVAFGFVLLAGNLGLEISSLLAGLGLGGLAFALAAQETLKNLFGTVTIIADRPFDVGDAVRIGDLEGEVETVGFRSTRLRTATDSLVTVPNSILISATVDNLGARRFRRFQTTLSVGYQTPPEKIAGFCADVRELLLAHPKIRKDQTFVHLNQFGANSLDILLFTYIEAPTWRMELEIREALMIGVLRLAEKNGVAFSPPARAAVTVNPDTVPT